MTAFTNSLEVLKSLSIKDCSLDFTDGTFSGQILSKSNGQGCYYSNFIVEFE